MTVPNLASRVRELIGTGGLIVLAQTMSQLKIDVNGKMSGFRSACLSFIESVYSPTHSYYKAFEETVSVSDINTAQDGISIMNSILSEIEGGWLFTVKGLVTAELFSNFLEMAEHLLENNYKDAAAVMIGSVLEEHLRQLCNKHSIDITITKSDGSSVPKKAGVMNSDLASAKIYSKLDQKSVTTWLDLRNSAAHGHYGNYNQDQTEQMLRGVSEFVARITI